MLGGFAKSLFGSSNDRTVARLRKQVERVNAFEAEISALSDEDLRAQTQIFRQRLEAGETLDQLLPEAFATVREAAHRTLGQRPVPDRMDVQPSRRIDAVHGTQIIAATVALVARMQRLVQVADEVDQERQRLDPLHQIGLHLRRQRLTVELDRVHPPILRAALAPEDRAGADV